MTDLDAWPAGKRAAAVLTFDLDANELWRVKRENDSEWDKPPIRNRGEFGPKVGVPRILELLDRYDLRATFFVPGKVAENWPDTIQAIHDAGHEIGHHGYTHTNPATATASEEKKDVKRAMDVFDDLIGDTPVGYRSPAADLGDNTLEILADNGIVYESSFIDSDMPYVHDVDGTDLVEIPFEWSLDDWPYFGFQMYPPLPYQSGISTTSEVFDSWTREFEGQYKRGRCFMLTMHPQIIGRAGRIDALEELVQTMIQTGDTWITTGKDLAEYWLKAQV
ncbi:polysaccharide deacetylase family protein [Natronosalvus rutilus]|uniref:Polysaccharide deacetylase n=1 Tax=Natronosalvus rutilus TaxID=2953753 RepID=A0A9E7NC96_9EURY|nr:polysaccharide deacetylase [Natronosalvus rutilus]UTF55652.1 polysaccharide deacetylase [Natronosalvus rutilus]